MLLFNHSWYGNKMMQLCLPPITKLSLLTMHNTRIAIATAAITTITNKISQIYLAYNYLGICSCKMGPYVSRGCFVHKMLSRVCFELSHASMDKKRCKGDRVRLGISRARRYWVLRFVAISIHLCTYWQHVIEWMKRRWTNQSIKQ